MKTRTTISRDQYFTSEKAANDTVHWLTETGWFNGVETIIEPCTGGKALVNAVTVLLLRYITVNQMFSVIKKIKIINDKFTR